MQPSNRTEVRIQLAPPIDLDSLGVFGLLTISPINNPINRLSEKTLRLGRMKLARYIVLRDGVVTKFPWIVISADDGKPALWEHNAKIARCRCAFARRSSPRPRPISCTPSRARNERPAPRGFILARAPAWLAPWLVGLAVGKKPVRKK